MLDDIFCVLNIITFFGVPESNSGPCTWKAGGAPLSLNPWFLNIITIMLK